MQDPLALEGDLRRQRFDPGVEVSFGAPNVGFGVSTRVAGL